MLQNHCLMYCEHKELVITFIKIIQMVTIAHYMIKQVVTRALHKTNGIEIAFTSITLCVTEVEATVCGLMLYAVTDDTTLSHCSM